MGVRPYIRRPYDLPKRKAWSPPNKPSPVCWGAKHPPPKSIQNRSSQPFGRYEKPRFSHGWCTPSVSWQNPASRMACSSPSHSRHTASPPLVSKQVTSKSPPRQLSLLWALSANVEMRCTCWLLFNCSDTWLIGISPKPRYATIYSKKASLPKTTHRNSQRFLLSVRLLSVSCFQIKSGEAHKSTKKKWESLSLAKCPGAYSTNYPLFFCVFPLIAPLLLV